MSVARSWYFLIVLFFIQSADAQDGSSVMQLPCCGKEGDITFGHFSDYIQDTYGISTVYNTSAIREEESVAVANINTIGDVLAYYSEVKELEYTIKQDRILFVKKAVSDAFSARGRVFDKLTGEYLAGVIVEDVDAGAFTYSDDFGYFTLSTALNHRLLISHIGFENDTITVVDGTLKEYALDALTTFSTVVIKDKAVDENIVTGSQLITSDIWNTVDSEVLDGNIDKILQKQPSIHSGSEGQTGFFIKGGTPDQNLVMLDYMPLYESSHTYGLNSIFIQEALKSVELNDDAVPAHYGDRLSASLLATVKAGNKYNWSGNVYLKLREGLIQLDGPILKKKLTLNLAYRKSLLNAYLPSILKKYTPYQSANVDYWDRYVKATYNVDNTQTISFLYYGGSDRLALGRTDTLSPNGAYSNVESDLQWKNTLFSANYNNVLSNRFHLHLHMGYLDYNQRTKGTYEFVSDTTQVYESLVVSGNKDLKMSASIDYYPNDKHSIRFGVDMLRQDLGPGLNRSNVSVADSIYLYQGVKRYKSFALSTYLEDVYSYSKHLQLYTGLRFTQYYYDKNYITFQPRIKLRYRFGDDRWRLSAAFARNTQFLHLLVNNGVGLPSDLWVPSTKDISPGSSYNYDLSLRYHHLQDWRLQFGVFYKRLYNVIDYSDEISLFVLEWFRYKVNNVRSPSFEWERFVNQGDGRQYGIHGSVGYYTQPLSFWVHYSYSRNKRRFYTINSNGYYPYRYDRPHDLNIGVKAKLSERWTILGQFIYTTGYTFSMALEEYDTILGVKRLGVNQRNNFRMPAYHRLDVSFRYARKIRKGLLALEFGIRNLYNRKNGQYIYLHTNTVTSERSLRKVALFPILPELKLSYRFSTEEG